MSFQLESEWGDVRVWQVAIVGPSVMELIDLDSIEKIQGLFCRVVALILVG